MSDEPPPPPVPAVLRLTQQVVLGRWRATGEELYREVARLAEVSAGRDVLIAGCGDGALAEWLATRTGAHVTGVDPDAARIAIAERRIRRTHGMVALGFSVAPLEDLPHETGVFDAVIAEPALAASRQPAKALAELLRVAKPMAPVILLQPTWSSEIAREARALVVERLGLQPYLLVEWKQMLRAAGAVEIQVQDWSNGAPGARTTEDDVHLSWQHKVHIVGRAWRRWGMRSGALDAGRSAVERERRLLRELSRERALGLQLIKGVKWPHARVHG